MLKIIFGMIGSSCLGSWVPDDTSLRCRDDLLLKGTDSCCAAVVAVVLERCGTWVYVVGFCKRKRVEIVIYIKLYIIHVSYLLRHVHKVL